MCADSFLFSVILNIVIFVVKARQVRKPESICQQEKRRKSKLEVKFTIHFYTGVCLFLNLTKFAKHRVFTLNTFKLLLKENEHE